MEYPSTPSRHSLQGSSAASSNLLSTNSPWMYSSDSRHSGQFPSLSTTSPYASLPAVPMSTPRLRATNDGGANLGSSPLHLTPLKRNYESGTDAILSMSEQCLGTRAHISFSLPYPAATALTPHTPSRRLVRRLSHNFGPRVRRTSSGLPPGSTQPFIHPPRDSTSTAATISENVDRSTESSEEGQEWLLTTLLNSPSPRSNSRSPTLSAGTASNFTPPSSSLTKHPFFFPSVGTDHYSKLAHDPVGSQWSSSSISPVKTVSQRRLSFVRTPCSSTIDPQSVHLVPTQSDALSRISSSRTVPGARQGFYAGNSRTLASESTSRWAVADLFLLAHGSPQFQSEWTSRGEIESDEFSFKIPRRYHSSGQCESKYSVHRNAHDATTRDPADLMVCKGHPVRRNGDIQLPCTPRKTANLPMDPLIGSPIVHNLPSSQTRSSPVRPTRHRATPVKEEGRCQKEWLRGSASPYQLRGRQAKRQGKKHGPPKAPRRRTKSHARKLRDVIAVPSPAIKLHRLDPEATIDNNHGKSEDKKSGELTTATLSIPLVAVSSTTIRQMPCDVQVRMDKFPGFYQCFKVPCQLPSGLRDKVYCNEVVPLPHAVQMAMLRSRRAFAGADFNHEAEALNLYTPRFTRGTGMKKEGLCPICYEDPTGPKEVWHKTKVSAYNYHLSVQHGINFATGLPFAPPLKFRTTTRKPRSAHERKTMLQGLCHSCRKWVDVESTKSVEVKVPELYFRKHAIRCHKGKGLSGLGCPFVQDELYQRVAAALKPQSGASIE